MQFADLLEQASDFTAALNKLIRRTIREHKRIIFNGNNYTDEWVEEAERRGLLNLRTTPEALPLFAAEKTSACSPSTAFSPRPRFARGWKSYWTIISKRFKSNR